MFGFVSEVLFSLALTSISGPICILALPVLVGMQGGRLKLTHTISATKTSLQTE